MTHPWDELNIIRSKLEKLELAETVEPASRRSSDGGYPWMVPSSASSGSSGSSTATAYRSPNSGGIPGVNTPEEKPKKKYDAEKCIDIVYEYLEMCWTIGVANANDSLNTSYASQDAEMRAAIYEKVAGEDFTQRIRKWAEKGDLDAMVRVAETDANRVTNEASTVTAKKAKAKYKTWITMEDDKVRPTHQYLHGMKIPANDYFVTFDGDKAKEPEKFSKAENNVNCRCQLHYTYE